MIFSLESSNLPQKTVDTSLIQRFSRVFRESGLNQTLFGKRIGQKQHAISQVLGGEREPSKAMIQAIITEFEVSPEWMMKGEGEPFKAHEAPAPAAGPYATASDLAELKGAVRAHVEQWERGQEKVLERLLDALQRIEKLERGANG